MALPTKEKTWQFDVNVTRASALAAMVGFKDSMKAFGSSPWTVWGSSNGVAYGNNDGVDRWGTPAQGGWIVLKQPGLGANFSWCMQYTSSINGEWESTISFAGFNTDGTATVRPTASDEFMYTSSQAQKRPYPLAAGVSHIMQSSDGQCLRWFRCASNKAVSVSFIEKLKDPISGWTGAVAVGRLGDASIEQTTYALWNDATSIYASNGSSGVPCYLTSEGWGSSTLGEQITFPDDDTSEYPASPIYLATTTVGSRGPVKGSLYDLWWGSTTPVTGDCYPGDGSRQFVQFGDMIFPWNGSTPVIA